LNQSTTGNAATATNLENPASVIGGYFYHPGYVSGNYYFASPFFGGTSASSTLTNNTVRVHPWTVTASVTITRLFAEFTVAGDANSVFRIGIWNHNPATGRPGTLALDAGSISTGTGNAGTVSTGGTPGTYELTVSQALAPGMYWIGGAVQGVTTTQPTMRTITGLPFFVPLGTTLPSASTAITAQAFGQSGAFVAANSPGNSTTAWTARIGFKVA
jgi:hypothetical protein